MIRYNSFSILSLIFIMVCSFSTAPSLNAQTCADTLKMHGVSLDSLDMEWLSQHPDSCRGLIMHLDTSSEMIASIQIVIKLQSNDLMFLPYDQLDPNEKLLTEIIHGTFTEHNLGERNVLSAISWYQIFMRQILGTPKIKYKE